LVIYHKTPDSALEEVGELREGCWMNVVDPTPEDVLTEIGQAIQMTDVSTGILSQMMDAFASIISNNLNVVMKFLASATIVIALPTLVASIYGMNLALPLQEHPQAFWIAMGGALVISAVVITVFIRKDWL
jgi:magnesium transporter